MTIKIEREARALLRESGLPWDIHNVRRTGHKEVILCGKRVMMLSATAGKDLGQLRSHVRRAQEAAHG